MDEVTTDLDVVSRQALLQFLREECDQRGATVIYSTHIFDGLDDWPSHVLHLKHGTVEYCGPIADAPASAPAPKEAEASSSGSLFQQVRGWLIAEREEKKQIAQSMHVEVESTPPTPPTAAAPAPARPANKFDRFGGGSRHSMYR